MAIRNLKMLSVDGSSITFGDPQNINNRLRFKNGVGPKTVDGVTTTNVRNEITWNEPTVMTQGALSAIDNLSVKVIISGSTQNSAVLKAAWSNMKTNVDAAIEKQLIEGFKPDYDQVFVTGTV